jgi:hypothetical protein
MASHNNRTFKGRNFLCPFGVKIFYLVNSAMSCAYDGFKFGDQVPLSAMGIYSLFSLSLVMTSEQWAQTAGNENFHAGISIICP